MIRAKLNKSDGRQVMIVGLSGENVTRLVAGEPIMHAMEDAGFPGVDLVILYGKTEADVTADLRLLQSNVGRMK